MKLTRAMIIVTLILAIVLGLGGCATISPPASAPPVEAPAPPPTEQPATTTPTLPAPAPEPIPPPSPTPEPSPPPQETYTLSVIAYPSSGGSASLIPAGGTYTSDTEVTLTATPSSGYRFSSWSGDIADTNPTIIITMNSNKSITALFEELPPEQYTLSVAVCPDGSGVFSLSPTGGTYVNGTNVTLSVAPYPMEAPIPGRASRRWEFVSFSGDVSGTSSKITITMDSNKSITAHFKEVFLCDYCPTMFDTIEELQAHVRAEHPGEPIPIEIEWE